MEMRENVLHSSPPTTLARGARKSKTPRCSKEEKIISPILKFVGAICDALVEVATQVLIPVIA